MAWKEMLVAPTQEGGAKNLKAFEATDHLDAPGNGTAILIPDDVRYIGVLSKPTGCETKTQYSNDLVSEVKAGTADWYDVWWLGFWDEDEWLPLFPVTAVRLVQNGAGSSDLRVRAQ